MRSGLIDNSMSRYRRKSASFPYPGQHNEILTFPCKVKQGREVLSVRHPRALPSELVEELVAHRLNRTQTRLGRVLEQLRDKIDGFCRSARPEDLGHRHQHSGKDAAGPAKTHFREGVRFDLGELMLHIIRIHGLDLLPRRCSQNLDNLHQLVDATLTREQWLTQHQLCHNAPR